MVKKNQQYDSQEKAWILKTHDYLPPIGNVDRNKVIQFWSDFYDHALKLSEITSSYQECFPTKNDSIYKQLVFKRLEECRGGNLSDDELRNLQLFIEDTTLEFDEKSMYKTVPNVVLMMFCRGWISITFAMAGLPGKTLLKLPFGFRISSGFLIRAVFILFFFLFMRTSILMMNDLLKAAAQFCSTLSETIAGPGGNLPDPSGGGPILPIFPQNQGDEDTGSPGIWSNLSPIQQLPSPSPEVGPSTLDQPQGSGESWFSRLMKLPTPTSEEEVGGPGPVSTPANVGASVGAQSEDALSAGPSNASSFPYDENEIIGGDSVAFIRLRIMSKEEGILFEEAHYRAEDLFDIKAQVIQEMSHLDLDGDWMNRGARALDYPKSRIGEYSLEKLHEFLADLKNEGHMSKTFSLLKERVLRRRP